MVEGRPPFRLALTAQITLRKNMTILDVFHLKSFNNTFHIGGMLLLAFCIFKKALSQLKKDCEVLEPCWSPTNSSGTTLCPQIDRGTAQNVVFRCQQCTRMKRNIQVF